MHAVQVLRTHYATDPTILVPGQSKFAFAQKLLVTSNMGAICHESTSILNI